MGDIESSMILQRLSYYKKILLNHLITGSLLLLVLDDMHKLNDLMQITLFMYVATTIIIIHLVTTMTRYVQKAKPVGVQPKTVGVLLIAIIQATYIRGYLILRHAGCKQVRSMVLA